MSYLRKSDQKFAIYIGQDEIEFCDNTKDIGSFGAGPCTIITIYDEKIGTILGHISEYTDLNYILKLLFEKKDLFNNYKNAICIFTESKYKANNKLIKKILNKINIFNFKTIKTIKSMHLIIKQSKNIYIDFDYIYSCFDSNYVDNKLEKIKYKYEMLILLSSKTESELLHENYLLQPHIKEGISNKSLDKYGRKPRPEINSLCYYHELSTDTESDIIIGKWIFDINLIDNADVFLLYKLK